MFSLRPVFFWSSRTLSEVLTIEFAYLFRALFGLGTLCPSSALLYGVVFGRPMLRPAETRDVLFILWEEPIIGPVAAV